MERKNQDYLQKDTEHRKRKLENVISVQQPVQDIPED